MKVGQTPRHDSVPEGGLIADLGYHFLYRSAQGLKIKSILENILRGYSKV